MTSFIVYARGDDAGADTGELNVQGTDAMATTRLAFRPMTGTGVVALEFNGGSTDPDAVVVIDGATYSLTVEFTGTLPQARKLRDVGGSDLRGRQITAISAGGQRFFFLSDGPAARTTMDAFPEGPLKIENLDTGPATAVCLAAGTMIQTPLGERPVEQLQPGELVTNAAGRSVPLLWRSSRRFTVEEMLASPALQPVRIARDALGPGLPNRDLIVAGQHRVVIGSPDNPYLFGTDKVLVTARHLRAAGVGKLPPTAPLAFHHLLFERHETILSNGLESESFQPTLRNLAGLSTRARASYRTAVSGSLRRQLRGRQDAYYSLRCWEATALGDPSAADEAGTERELVAA